MTTIYRGCDIEQEPNGLFVWTDAEGRVHNGKVDLQGGFKTEEAAMDDIDAHRKNLLRSQNT